MDKSVFEKYIAEMKNMSKRAIPAAAEPEREVREAPTMLTPPTERTGEGYLSVNVTSVHSLYPIENAKVTVFTGQRENMVRLCEGYTDSSGKTEIFPLPAPPISLAQNSQNTLPVFAEYNILTEADGFIPAVNYSLAVFDKVTSLQNINMIPKSVFSDNSSIVTDEENDYEL